MQNKAPIVLFADEDAQALDQILLRIEPTFTTVSLRTVAPLMGYVRRLHPDVVVLSDRLRYRRQDSRRILSRLCEEYRGAIILLTDCLAESERLHWMERGAHDCLLHPTRTTERILRLADRIFELAHRRNA